MFCNFKLHEFIFCNFKLHEFIFCNFKLHECFFAVLSFQACTSLTAGVGLMGRSTGWLLLSILDIVVITTFNMLRASYRLCFQVFTISFCFSLISFTESFRLAMLSDTVFWSWLSRSPFDFVSALTSLVLSISRMVSFLMFSWSWSGSLFINFSRRNKVARRWRSAGLGEVFWFSLSSSSNCSSAWSSFSNSDLWLSVGPEIIQKNVEFLSKIRLRQCSGV